VIILGIDPGSRKAGFAVVESIGRKLRYIDSGTLHFDAKVGFLDRLLEIKQKIDELAITYQPDEIALESLIYVKSPSALIKLAQARGVIISSFLETHQYKIFEYSPNLIKTVTTGHGHADKDSVQKSLTTFLGVKDFKTDDESDALAVAYCHSLYRGKVTPLKTKKRKKGRGLSGALSHKIG